MRFEKWHGIGNDFLLVHEDDVPHSPEYVVIGERGQRELRPEVVQAICHRHFGVGADGILVISNSVAADAHMLILNADGSQALMCGNGIRVAARYAASHGYVPVDAAGSCTIETAGGIMRPTLLDGDLVRVDMGAMVDAGSLSVHLSDVDMSLIGESLDGIVVHAPNPHFVVLREPAGPDLHRLGPAAEVHPSFPDRTNVEFIAIDDAGGAGRDARIRMRVWERGVGETLACGTGACAVAWAATCHHGVTSPARVELPGGELRIEFDGATAFMTGAARYVFGGTIDLARLLPAGTPVHAGPSSTPGAS